MFKKFQRGFLLNPFRFGVGGDPNFVNVSLLLHSNGSNGPTTITDSSLAPKTLTVLGNAQISTSQSKFGDSSIYFDGNSDRLSTPTDTAFQLGTGDFTIEMFVRPDAGGSGIDYFISTAYLGAEWFVISYNHTTNVFKLQGVPSVGGDSPTYATGTWHHIAISRVSGTGYFYVNGVVAHAFPATADYSQQIFYIGGADSSIAAAANWFQGHIDEVRITKGVGRYTANFTPPTAAFPDV